MFGPMRNLRAYIQGLDRLEKMNLPFDYVYPSHADLPLEPGIIRGLIEDASEILNGDADYKNVTVHGQTVRAYVGRNAVFLCDNT